MLITNNYLFCLKKVGNYEQTFYVITQINSKNKNRDKINTWISLFCLFNTRSDNGAIIWSSAIGYVFMRDITLNFRQATHLSLIQNESHQQSPEKRENNGKHENRDNIFTWIFWVNSLMKLLIDLHTWSKKIYLQSLLAKHSDTCRFPNGFTSYSPIETKFFQFFDNFLKFQEIVYLNHLR